MCLIIPILNYFLGRYEKHSITSQVTSFLCIPKRTFIVSFSIQDAYIQNLI